MLFTTTTPHCVGFNYRSEFNSCCAVCNKSFFFFYIRDGEGGGRETQCFTGAEGLSVVIISILYPPLKICFTEALVCIFIDISWKAKCFKKQEN